MKKSTFPTICLLPVLVVLTGCPADKDDDDPCEGEAPLASTQEGVCDGAVQVCDPDLGWVDDLGSITDYEATESSCDGLDNDCDGEADAGLMTTYYLDDDDDGFGDDTSSQEACEAPADHVTNDTDCDDADADVHPDATEVCDDVDNDCDTDIDEDVLTTYYLDDDDDGFGVADTTTEACTEPTGYSALSTDCDDTDAEIHPDAAEICDGADNDCNDEVDDFAVDTTDTHHDYITQHAQLPTTGDTPPSIGLDLDDDTVIDNRLGAIMGALNEDAGIATHEMLNSSLRDGMAVLPFRMYIDPFPTDDEILVQTFEADQMTTPAPDFDGSDTIDVTTGTPTEDYFCGEITSNDLSTQPRTTDVPLPLFGGNAVPVVMVPMVFAQVIGAADAAGFDIVIGGAISQDSVDTIILPALAQNISDYVTWSGHAHALALLTLFDESCDNTIPGCESVVNGTGECTAWSGSGLGAITETELLCNRIMHDLMVPDMDSDGDTVADVLSFGVTLQGVPATIVLP